MSTLLHEPPESDETGGEPPEPANGAPPTLVVNPDDHDAELVKEALDALRDAGIRPVAEYHGAHQRAWTLMRAGVDDGR